MELRVGTVVWQSEQLSLFPNKLLYVVKYSVLALALRAMAEIPSAKATVKKVKLIFFSFSAPVINFFPRFRDGVINDGLRQP